MTTVPNYADVAKDLVFSIVKKKLETEVLNPNFSRDDVYTCWGVKVLQNWKYTVSTTMPDDMYYEVTFNGDTGEAYVDSYRKIDNAAIRIENPLKTMDDADQKLTPVVNWGKVYDVLVEEGITTERAVGLMASLVRANYVLATRS